MVTNILEFWEGAQRFRNFINDIRRNHCRHRKTALPQWLNRLSTIITEIFQQLVKSLLELCPLRIIKTNPGILRLSFLPRHRSVDNADLNHVYVVRPGISDVFNIK